MRVEIVDKNESLRKVEHGAVEFLITLIQLRLDRMSRLAYLDQASCDLDRSMRFSLGDLCGSNIAVQVFYFGITFSEQILLPQQVDG